MKTIELDWDGEKYIARLCDENGYVLGKASRFGEGRRMETAIGDLFLTGILEEFADVKLSISSLSPRDAINPATQEATDASL